MALDFPITKMVQSFCIPLTQFPLLLISDIIIAQHYGISFLSLNFSTVAMNYTRIKTNKCSF